MTRLRIIPLFILLVFIEACMIPGRRGRDIPEPLNVFLERARHPVETVFQFPEPETFTLDNGLTVLVVPRHDLPLVYFSAQIRGGSIYDPPDKSGLAYLTGWTLTEGTESYSRDEIDRVMDRCCAQLTSQSFNETCIVTLSCLSLYTERLFPYFAEVLSRPAFRQTPLEVSRKYITGDILMTLDDPGNLVYWCFLRDLFQGHPYGKSMMGTVEGIRNCSRDDVLAFHQRFYAPDRTVIAVVGDVTAEMIRRLCRTHLAHWRPASTALPVIPPPEPVHGIRIQVVDKDIAQAHIAMGHVGIDRKNPDRFTLEVLSRILGYGSTSRLTREVRVKRGLTYNINGAFAIREFTGEFAVSTFTQPRNTGATVSVILDVLKDIRSSPVTPSELEEAKLGLIGGYPLRFQRFKNIASTLTRIAFYGLPFEDITGYPAAINKVTADDVLSAARRYLHPSDIVVTVVGPAAVVVPQLERIAPVTLIDAL